MGLNRKTRRALAAERERLGLPKAKPWQHTRQNRILQLEKMFAEQDAQIARQLGLPVVLVQHFRKLVTVRLETNAPTVV
jgi:hypothetical protein